MFSTQEEDREYFRNPIRDVTFKGEVAIVEKNPLTLIDHIRFQIFVRGMSTHYSAPATLEEIHKFLNNYTNNSIQLTHIYSLLFGGTFRYYLLRAISPVLRFHFSDREVEEKIATGSFVDAEQAIPFWASVPKGQRWDSCPVPSAYKSKDPIPTSHLGVSGALRHGLDSDLPTRILSHSYKSLCGLGCIASSCLLTRNIYRDLTVKKVASKRTITGVFKRCLAFSGIFVLFSYTT